MRYLRDVLIFIHKPAQDIK